LGCHPLECGSDGCKEIGVGASLGASKQLLDLAPHLFDGIEVWRVSRKEEHLSPGLFDEGEGLFALVGSKVVHDHDVSWAQSRAKDLADVLSEDFRVRGPLDGHTGGGAIEANRTEDGCGVPMSGRSRAVDALAARGAAPQPGHVGFGSRLVQEDQPRWVEARLAPPPRPPRLGDVGTVLLTGPERLFFKVSPIFSNA